MSMELTIYVVIGARSVIYTLCSIIVFVLAVISVAVDVGSVGPGGAANSFTLWNAGCGGTSPDASPYADFNNTVRAARAFGILVILFTTPCFVIGMMDLLNKRNVFGSYAAQFKWIMVIAAAFCLVFATITWPMMFDLPSMLSHDVGAGSSFTIEGAGPVMLVAWVFIIAMICAAIFLPPALPEEHSPAGKTVTCGPPPPVERHESPIHHQRQAEDGYPQDHMHASTEANRAPRRDFPPQSPDVERDVESAQRNPVSSPNGDSTHRVAAASPNAQHSP